LQYSLLNWAKQVMGMSSPPLVNSVSYGNDEKQQTGAAYMESCNTQFKAAALRGLSILFASGDQGVCGREGCGIFGGQPFHPDFPAASPYITAVGGTDFATKSVIGDETAWTAGGGGFSNEFGIPDYQKDAVAAYQNDCPNCPPQKLWNATGRGYPDISALGGQVNPYCVHAQGAFNGVAGTSAACPVAAAVFAKLNDVRIRGGKAPLGFLNPFIYQNAAAFNDVTTGCNKANGKYGFTASNGWDPATGVGTPNFAALSKLM
jgi:tripeptidyl-peptidase-1